MRLYDKDLRVEFYKSGGPGGQHKNKRQTAVRITHLPTGISAVAAEERSQAQNRNMAIARLRGKLKALISKRKPRIPTRTPAAVKQRVKQRKILRSEKKKSRAKVVISGPYSE
ncbi:MAG: peptide chain release factor-like protein [Candidatus Omnitrophica bacterium]|nr:peptide chain release factor-like protein [Candidatus Omnitrophota bacterium]